MNRKSIRPEEKSDHIGLLLNGKDRRIDMILSCFLAACIILALSAVFGESGPAGAQAAKANDISPGSGNTALYDGTPWIIKSDGKQIAYVKTKEAGEQVLTGLKIKYCHSVAGQQKSEIVNAVTVEKAPHGVYKTSEILDTEKAVRKIARLNKSSKDKAPVTVALSKVVEKDKKVGYKTKIVKSSQLERGKKQIKVKGRAGSRRIVSDVITENGEYADETVIDSEVTKKPVDKVVVEGTKLTTSDKGELLVRYACRFLGTKYVWGGSDLRKGIDCSGFTMQLYGKVGISMPHFSDDQAKLGEKVDYKDAQPGDLIIYKGHVGLYMGNNMMIHATPGKVQITDDCRYRKIKKIRRIFNDDDGVTQEMFDKLFEEEYNKGALETAREKLSSLEYYTMKDGEESDIVKEQSVSQEDNDF